MLDRLETSMTTSKASQERDHVLTLLLIERDQVNEKLLELGFGEIKSPAVRRGKQAKRPSNFVQFGTMPRTVSQHLS
jgi:hypothetical protein